MKITRHKKSVAEDNRYLNKVLRLLDGKKTPSEIECSARAALFRLGYKVVQKKVGISKWKYMTTTLRGQVRLAKDFYDYSPEHRAAVFMHELVHAYQWRGEGTVRFALRYLVAPWRWAYEIQAYRVNVHVYKKLGRSTNSINLWIIRRGERLNNGYNLGRLEGNVEETIRILEEEFKILAT